VELCPVLDCLEESYERAEGLDAIYPTPTITFASGLWILIALHLHWIPFVDDTVSLLS